MNSKTVSKRLIALFFAGLAISCSKLEQNQPMPDSNFRAITDKDYSAEVIPLDLAKQVAENDAFQKLYLPVDSAKAAKNGRLGSLHRTVRQAISFKDKYNQPALHVMTYDQGGFAILSAERSFEAVLAVGDETNVDVNQMPEVVKAWLGEKQLGVEQLRITKRSARVGVGSQGPSWGSLLATAGLSKQSPNGRVMGPCTGVNCPDDIEPQPCQQTGRSFFYPLVPTKWDQTGGCASTGGTVWCYNQLTPNYASAGCSPIAAAQLMYYFNYPQTYVKPGTQKYYESNFDRMELNKATPDLAQFLYAIGYYAKSKWGATAGAATSTANSNLLAALKNNFGLKNSYLQKGPTMLDILAHIKANRPVFLSGSMYSGGSSGHAWVVDGYMRTTSTCAVPEWYWLHMNWGWGGLWNGYFSDSYSSAITGTTYYDVVGNEKHMPDQDPNHNNNSDVFYFYREMIVFMK